MDLPHDTETIDDLSALAWVQDELRRSLEAAHKAMRRYLKEADAMAGSDVDAVDPGVLRNARAQLHQGVGALELVGLPAAAQLLRASEAALQKLCGRPVTLTAAAAETIEQASFALIDYLTRLLAEKPVSPLALFPQYRAVQELAGADRIHPADLWLHDWQWHEIAADPSAVSQRADAATRVEVETRTLALMRQPDGPAAAQLSDVFAGLAAGAREGQTQPAERWLATSWQMASAFFEAQAQGLLRPDIYSKRVASRLLAQLRMSERGDAAQAGVVSQRLAQDLLFFCAQAASPGDGRHAPRLAGVRLAWNLARRAPVDYLATQLGRFDPTVIAQAKKRVGAAKESWSAVAGDELHRLGSLNEQFHLVGESLKKLYPSGDKLAQALANVAAQTAASGAAPPPALAMEVATAVLYLEASLEDGEFDHPAQAERVRRLADRVARVQGGSAPDPLEAWMEELYRRVSDRQTMGSVVQELRGSLTEAEKAIDAFFRQPAAREQLHPVPGQLNSMRGVFSVLGLDHASHAVVRMRDDVDALAVAKADSPDAAAVERLASNLGALGFLIDMLSVQPAMAKSLFAFDAASGLLRSVAAGGSHRASEFGALDAPAATPPPVEPRLIEQAQSLALSAAHPEVPLAQIARELERLSQEAMVADQPVLAETMNAVKTAFAEARDDDQRQAVREELAQAMADFVHTSSEAAALDALAPPRPLLPATPTPAGKTGLEDDAEMREIFLEEAREVIGNAEQALAALVSAADDLGEMTTVRRAFHTLKGSARMVGLAAFGEAAWSCEQLFNRRLADAMPADGELLALTTDVLAYLGDWVESISARRDGGHRTLDVQGAVDAFGLRGQHGTLGLPGAPMVLNGEQRPAMPAAAAAPASAQRVPVTPWVEAVPAPSMTMPLVSAPMLLFDMLPELPSAEDLELRPAASAIQPIDRLLSTEAEIDFELDLGDAVGLPVAGADAGAVQPIVSPEPDADAPSPDPISALMSLDIREPTRQSRSTPLHIEIEAPRAAPQAAPPVLAAAATTAADAQAEPEPYKQIGALRVGIPLFNIFLNEADEQSRRLGTELAEWAHELHRPVGDSAIALAHSLAGNSAAVGFADLSQLARLLEHALARSQALGAGDATEALLFNDSANEIRRLLHQFAAGFLKAPAPPLLGRLVDHERHSAERLQTLALQPEAQDSAADVPPSMLEVAEAPIAAEPAPVAAPTAIAAHAPQVQKAADAPAPATEPAVAAKARDIAHALLDFGQVPFHSLAELAPLGSSAEVRRLEMPALSGRGDDDDLDAVDAVDAELFPFFEEEAAELLPQLASRLRDWAERPDDAAGAAACMRTLHTIKGGARLAGAMRLGELAHRLETAIERLAATETAASADVEALFARVDAIGANFDALCGRATVPAEPVAAESTFAAPVLAVTAPAPAPALTTEPEPEPPSIPVDAAPETASRSNGELPPIDWQRFAANAPSATLMSEFAGERQAVQGAGSGTVRVRAQLLDRLVNHAGEVSIARSRIDAEVGQLKASLGDLTENLGRLRSQLREIELQAETQIGSRLEAAKAVGETFDPLEMDRFTRFQELTRMMAESVNDVATVQRSFQRTLQAAEDDLAAQARLTRDLQDDLLRTRMVEFESLSDRLYRVARQAAKETHKQVRLDLVGGSIEVDRGVLERMAGAFEHLLRNCVTHGIELPAVRQAAGKDAAGQITVSAAHEGNEVAVEVRDDGGGLDLGRIRQRGIELGLIAADRAVGDAELAQLIFTPGFSTAESVTELAGRGIGMDVVRSEVIALGGRIETASAPGQGTSFRMLLPLTTAVTQVVMLRAGEVTVAVPATLIEIVRRAKRDEVAAAHASGRYTLGGTALPFFWLGALLQAGGRSQELGSASRSLYVVVVKSAQQRIALHVDDVLGNQEVVVKNLGAQLSRVPGLAGITLLASGAPALIYNPVALATLYGEQALLAMQGSEPSSPQQDAAADAVREAPLVLVVDDSLTVRRVTQRLLVREGYRVVLAKDGLDAIDKLAEELPAVVLSDIEMPRMDGFDLVRNLRADARLRNLPVIMITSRIAQKHRDHAAELGVDHYLGKPYAEEDLLSLVARYTATHSPA